jgi:hypothetical protein
MKIEIKNRFTGEVILCGEYKSVRDCLEKNRGACLARADLAGADLAGACLVRASLARANLARASLARANLARANLVRANLTGADLARANLARACLVRASLFGADLAGVYLAGANLFGAKGNKGEIISICGTLPFAIVFVGDEVRIGCETKTKKEWLKVTVKQAIEMGLEKTWIAKYRKIIKVLG